MASEENLGRAKYINLRSFRKDGSPVDTPVWVAGLDDQLIVFTLEDSYKVKRVRRNPKVEVARCDIRGGLLGPWRPGSCVEVERGSELEARGYAALNRKYGLVMRVGTVLSTLTGRVRKRLMLAITLD